MVLFQLTLFLYLCSSYRKVAGDTCSGGMEDHFSAVMVSCRIGRKEIFIYNWMFAPTLPTLSPNLWTCFPTIKRFYFLSKFWYLRTPCSFHREIVTRFDQLAIPSRTKTHEDARRRTLAPLGANSYSKAITNEGSDNFDQENTMQSLAKMTPALRASLVWMVYKSKCRKLERSPLLLWWPAKGSILDPGVFCLYSGSTSSFSSTTWCLMSRWCFALCGILLFVND